MSGKDLLPILKEGPLTVSMMSVIIESGGSLDAAVRNVMECGPPKTRSLFLEIVVDADTRMSSDIRTGLDHVLSSLPKELASFRRSLHMLMAASEMLPGPEKVRILNDATDISLIGLKDAGETFSSSLTNYCIAIFGLGIMVPMIMMSILPILQFGDTSGKMIGAEPVIVMTLIIIPAGVLCITLGIKSKNPLGSEKEDNDWIGVAMLLTSIPLAIASWILTKDVLLTILIATIPSGFATFVFLYPSQKKERRRLEVEAMLKDSVFELGNRLISGENFETSVLGALETRSDTYNIAESLRKGMVICRGDMGSAIRTAIEPTSILVADTYYEVHRSSQKDIREAGRLAISVGRQMQDRESVLKNLSNKLKSMLDMMTATAAMFAPLVLGLCIAMLGPLSELTESADMSGISVIIGIYLIELCALIAMFTTTLAGKDGLKSITYRFSMMLPLSMTIFYLSTRMLF